MDFSSPLRGKQVGGLWVPDSALETKSDRTQSGMVPSGSYSGVLNGASGSESKFRDYQSYLESVKTVPWVYACVSLLSYSFATAPGDLFDDSDEVVEDPGDPFLQIWNKPNPFQTGMVFRELLGMFIELAGEAYITLENVDSHGVPSEMYLPSPARMRIVQDKKTGNIIGYAYDTSGYQNGRYLPSFIPYDVDEVIHIKVANPLNQLRGLGNIEAMETTMDTMVAMSRNELSYWQSGGRITGVLESDQQVDDQTFDRLVDRWRQFTADKRQRFKTAILEQGLKYTPVAEGFKGLDYSKLDVAKRDFVLANFGVPKNKLGIIEDAQYKSDEADRFYWSETMEPRLTRFEDHMPPLVERFHPEGYYYRFQRKNFEDDTVKLNNAMVMKSLKAFTSDEIRRYIGVDPIGGKSGNVVILQQTDVVVEIDKLDSADVAAGTAGGGPPSTTAPDDLAQQQMDHQKEMGEQAAAADKSRADLGHTHQGNPGRAGGQAPLPGVSVQGNGNENGRTGAVDGTGHTASAPGANSNPGGGSKSILSPDKKFSPEVLAALTDAERENLVHDYERQLKAADNVRRAFRLRGKSVRATGTGMGLHRVSEYAEKRAALKAEQKAAFVPETKASATATFVQANAKRTRDALAMKYAPKLREAAVATRRALTPVLAKALKITTPEERRAYIKANFPSHHLADALHSLHVEAANAGWRMGKRILGFTPKVAPKGEGKAVSYGEEPMVSDYLDANYDRALAPQVQLITDRMQDDIEASIDEGLRRAYSPLQIANGVPDEDYGGVSSIFDGAQYDEERIARTESMFAQNWGQGSSLLDSGVQQVEALDGDDDPACAARDGQTYDIDPDTGLPVDDAGDPVRDHPNGTLAFIPTGDLSDLLETGAMNVEELGAEWEQKMGVGAPDAPPMHRHRNGTVHSHDGGSVPHAHRWNMRPKAATGGAKHVQGPDGHGGLPTISRQPHPYIPDPDYSDQCRICGMPFSSSVDGQCSGLAALAKAIATGWIGDEPLTPRQTTTETYAMSRKYTDAQPRDDHGMWSGGGTLADRAHYHAAVDEMMQRGHPTDALALLHKSGGFTYSMHDNSFTRIGDANKFGVSPYKGHETTLDNPMTRQDIIKYATDHGALLGKPDHYLGAWHDDATGKDVLDVSVVVPSEDMAHSIADANNQDAIFNFASGESIPTKALTKSANTDSGMFSWGLGDGVAV